MRLYSLVLPVLALCGTLAGATERPGGKGDYDFVKATTPVLNLSNPAALAGWDGRIAKAAVRFDKADGGLISLTQSPDSYEAVAGTESFYRISKRIAFFGHIDWSYFSGKDMGGPILMDPEYNPVNFYDSDPATTGTKNRESYSLKGALSYTFSDRWAAGLSVKFDGRDQTKLKDPRYLNYWTELAFDAGVSFRPSSTLLLGASAFYRNTLETVQGGIYGKTDQSYFFQIDRGGFFGTVAELVGDRAALSPREKRPMDNTLLGGALQLAVSDRFFSELTFTARNGYFGRRSSSSAVFFEFSGIEVRYDGAYLIPVGQDVHRFGLSAGFAMLSNEENTFNYVTPTGGVTRVEYTGQNHVLDRMVIDGKLSYRWFHGVEGQRPNLTVGADLTVYSKNQTTEMYPFYRDHGFTRLDADVFCAKDLALGSKSLLKLEAHGLFHTGFGVDKEDGQYAAGTSKLIKSFDMWLGPQYEFETASRAGGLLAVEWIPRFGKAVTPYVRISDSFMTLFEEPAYLKGSTRNIASIAVGISF